MGVTQRARPGNAWRYVLRVAVASRVVVILGLYLGHNAAGYPNPIPGTFAGVHNWWLNPFTTYDSEFFLRIAAKGYDRTSIAFFPLYPAILRTGGSSSVAMAAVGVLVSNIAFILGLWFAHQWLKNDRNEAVARRAVWLIAFAPLGIVWSSVYTESLFLLFLAGMLWSLRAERLWLAALLGVGVGATRNSGLVLSAALIAGLLLAPQRGFVRRLRPSSFLVALTPVLSFLVFEGWVVHRFGAAAPKKAQEAFGRKLGTPWSAIASDISAAVRHGPGLVATLNLAAVFVGLAVCLWAASRHRWTDAVLIVGVLAMHLSFPTGNVPHTTGAARYLLPLVPFHAQVAEWLDHPSFASPVIRRAAMASWALLAFYFAQQVGRRYFVLG